MGEHPKTSKKLREADFFLRRLAGAGEKTSRLRETFDFYLSAFLGAGRSVEWSLRFERKKEFSAWYEGWKKDLDTSERQLLNFMEAQRNAEVHQDGAGVKSDLELVPVTEIRARGEGVYWFGPPLGPVPKVGVKVRHFAVGGTIEEVLETCTCYLELLRKLVRDFERAVP